VIDECIVFTIVKDTSDICDIDVGRSLRATDLAINGEH